MLSYRTSWTSRRFITTNHAECVFNHFSAAQFVNSGHKCDGIGCRGNEFPLAIVEGPTIQCCGQEPGVHHFAAIECAVVKRGAVDDNGQVVERLISGEHSYLPFFATPASTTANSAEGRSRSRRSPQNFENCRSI